MADYSGAYEPSPAAVLKQQQEREAAEKKAYETGFRVHEKGVMNHAFSSTVDVTECLSCGCLVWDRTVHRKGCSWTPKVPKTIWVEADG